MKRWGFLSLILLMAGAPRPQASPVDKALAYLKSQQLPSGAWSGTPNDITDTSVAIEALAICLDDPALITGFNFLKAASVEGTDQSSRLLFGLTFSLENLTERRLALVALQGSDGGWGAAKGHRSSPHDTILAMRALSKPKALDAAAMQSSTSFILSQKLPSGGWALQPEGPEAEDVSGDLVTTSMIVMTLAQYQFDQGIETSEAFTALNAATNFILGKQNPNGSFGTDQSVLETAWAMRAIVRMNPSSPALASGKTFLENAQAANGSWTNDVHLTAIAALALFERAKPPLPPPADLTILAGTLSVTPASPNASQVVILQAVVKNIGGRKAYNVPVRFTVDTNPIGVLIFVPQIGPGETTTTSGSLLGLPSPLSSVSTTTTLPAGIHAVGVTVDPANVIPELSETNNNASISVNVASAPLPDLVIDSAQIVLSESNPFAGEEFTVSFPLQNTGGSPVSGAVLRVFDGNPGTGGVQKGSDLPIEVGAATFQPFAISISLTAGVHTIFLVADATGIIGESSEGNNVGQVTPTVVAAPLPDFYLTSDSITFTPVTPAAGNQVLVRAHIRNATPSAPAKPSLRPNVRVRLFRGDPASGGTPFGGDFVLPFIDPGPGSFAEVTASFQPGGHPVFVSIDPDNQLTEVTRANNVASRILSVASGNLADLFVASVSPSVASPQNGQPVLVTVTIQNAGTAAAENFRVRLKDGPTGPPLALDAIVASLAPGGSTSVVFGWASTAGTHILFAEADALSTVGESNETNNTGGVGIVVSATAFEPAVAASHKGKHFWLAWPATTISSAELVIQSDVATTYAVTGPGFSTSGNVGPGNPGIVVLPTSLESVLSTITVTTSNKTIQVISPADISVIFRTPAGTSQNADTSYRALPTNALGTRYLMFFTDSNAITGSTPFFPGIQTPPRGIAIVGTEDGTNISLASPFFGTFSPGPVNQGQLVHWPIGLNFSGAVLTATKPVVVYYTDVLPGTPFFTQGTDSFDP